MKEIAKLKQLNPIFIVAQHILLPPAPVFPAKQDSY